MISLDSATISKFLNGESSSLIINEPLGSVPLTSDAQPAGEVIAAISSLLVGVGPKVDLGFNSNAKVFDDGFTRLYWFGSISLHSLSWECTWSRINDLPGEYEENVDFVIGVKISQGVKLGLSAGIEKTPIKIGSSFNYEWSKDFEQQKTVKKTWRVAPRSKLYVYQMVANLEYSGKYFRTGLGLITKNASFEEHDFTTPVYLDNFKYTDKVIN